MNALISVRPFRLEDKVELELNAKKDGHAVFFPTHVLVKDEQIVGYWSLNALPLVLSWQDSKKVLPIDSVKAIGFIEGALCQYKHICIPCDPESPYIRFLPKNGYQKYTKPVELFVKGV
jgi:hypothetical protein